MGIWISYLWYRNRYEIGNIRYKFIYSVQNNLELPIGLQFIYLWVKLIWRVRSVCGQTNLIRESDRSRNQTDQRFDGYECERFCNWQITTKFTQWPLQNQQTHCSLFIGQYLNITWKMQSYLSHKCSNCLNTCTRQLNTQEVPNCQNSFATIVCIYPWGKSFLFF